MSYKKAKIIRDQPYTDNFNQCRQILCYDPILEYLEFTKEFVPTTDASDFAMRAVLSHGLIEKDRPVAYDSRTAMTVKDRIALSKKQTLTIVWASCISDHICTAENSYVSDQTVNLAAFECERTLN